MRAGSKPIANVAGVSLGELIDFCAECVSLGIPESTKLRAFTDSHTAVAVGAGGDPAAQSVGDLRTQRG